MNVVKLDEDLKLPDREACSGQMPKRDPAAVCAAFETDLFASCKALSLRQQAVARLSAMASTRDLGSMEHEVKNALDAELDADAITEVFLQSTIYNGVRGFEQSLATLDASLVSFGCERQQLAGETAVDLKVTSDAIRKQLHGARSSIGHADGDNAMTAPLYAITALHGYGAIWSRDGLTINERMVCALACLTTVGNEDVQVKFAQSARDAGLGVDGIRETIVLTVPWIGSPRALSALMAIGKSMPP